MQSIPMAIGGEMWNRGRWQILLAFVFIVGFPVMLYGQLLGAPPPDPRDTSLNASHFAISLVRMVVLITTVCSIQYNVAWGYTLPIRSEDWEQWRLTAGLAVVGTLMGVSSLLFNLLSGYNWPVAGPTLFAISAYAAVEAAMRWGERAQGWLLFFMCLVGFGWGAWYLYLNNGFTRMDKLWTEVTAFQLLTLLGAIAACYFVAAAGLAHSRRGDELPRLDLDWIASWFLPGDASKRRAFRSPAAALFWMEWRKKGWQIPTAAAISGAIGLVLWAIFSRDIENLVVGGVAVSVYSTVILCLIMGLVAGNVGSKDGDYVAGNFMASRPVTNRMTAHLILWTLAASISVTVVFWLLTLGPILLGIWLAGAWPELGRLELHWSMVPATLGGMWLTAALITTMGLTGRPLLFIILGVCVPPGCLAYSLSVAYFLPPQAARELNTGVALVLAALCIAGTLAALIAAARQRSVSPLLTGLLATLVLAACGVSLMWHFQQPTISLPGAAWIAALITLAILPIPAAPLAYGWNRHR